LYKSTTLFDKVLLSQLKRCHDTIEDLKKQRSQNSPHSECEEDDEEGHWEDWEIAGIYDFF
jgi:phosphohistidine phosphatase SixA